MATLRSGRQLISNNPLFEPQMQPEQPQHPEYQPPVALNPQNAPPPPVGQPDVPATNPPTIQPQSPISFKELQSVAEACPLFNGVHPKVESWLEICEQRLTTAALTGLNFSETHKIAILTWRLAPDSEAHKRWLLDSSQQPELQHDWTQFLQWTRQFAEVKNRGLEAVLKLKKLYQSHRSVDAVVTDLTAILHDIPDLTPQLKNLFFAASLEPTLRGLLSTSVQHQFTTTPFNTLLQNAKALSQAAQVNSSTHKPVHHNLMSPHTQHKSTAAKPTVSESTQDANSAKPKSLALQKLENKQYSSPPEYPTFYPTSLRGKLRDHAALKAFLLHNNICTFCRDDGHDRDKCPRSTGSKN